MLLLERPGTDQFGTSVSAFEMALEEDRQLKLALSPENGLEQPTDTCLVIAATGGRAHGSNNFVRIATLTHEMFQSQQTAAWFDDAVRRLTSFLTIHRDADLHRTRRVTDRAVTRAYRILQALSSDTLPRPALIPTLRGGVQIEWHTRGVDVEIEIAPSGHTIVDVEDLRDNAGSWSGDSSSDALRRVRSRLTA